MVSLLLISFSFLYSIVNYRYWFRFSAIYLMLLGDCPKNDVGGDQYD